MKKFIFVLLMLFSTSAFCVNADSLRTKIICEDGYKFLVVYSILRKTSPTVVQIFERHSETSFTRLPAVPKRCKK